MGIRIALGAERNDSLDLVVGEGMRTIVVGLIIGVVAARALGRLVASLFGIVPTDAGVLIGSAAILVLVAGAGCLIPGWRAAAVDPIRSLRVE